MSHRFETGFDQPLRTKLRQSVVDILSPLKRPTGYLGTVVPFGAVVRSWTDEIGIELLLKACSVSPAIAVALGTRTFETKTVGNLITAGDCELFLYFVSQHSRGLVDGRMEADVAAQINDHADPGLDIAMAHALELLLGQYPVQGTVKLKQLIPVREEELSTKGAETIWMQTWHCSLLAGAPPGRRAPEFRTAPQLLESIRWRTTTNPNEVMRPAAATDATSIDVDTNL